MRIGTTQEPIHLNPTISASGIVMFMANKVYEPLVRYGLEETWEPELAYSWESSDDLMTWTFHIYQNATWHDGKPITTEDVLYSYEAFTERHPSGTIFENAVASVEAPDDYTFVMHFDEVDISWTPNMPLLSILPKHIFDVEGTDILDNEATRYPYVGSGAFKFVEWKAGEYVRMVRNDNYYQKNKPYLDEIYFIFAPDSLTNAGMFEAGDIDFIAYGAPLEEMARWRENPVAGQYPGIYSGLKASVNSFMLMNDPEYSKYTSQQKFRQAMAYSWDYDRIIRDQTFGIGVRQHTLFPRTGPNQWSYNTEAKQYNYDPDMANQLLDELGYSWDSNNEWRIDPDTGDPVTLRANIGTSITPEMEIIVENLEDVGIKTDLRQYTGQASASVIFTDYDYDYYTWGGSFTGPDVSHIEEYMGTKYIAQGAMWANGARYSNPEVDDLFRAAVQTTDQSERKELYWQIQEIWGEEVPWIPTYSTGRASPHSQAFKGKFFPMNASMHQDPLKHIWWVYGELPAVTEPPVVVVPDTGDLEEKVEAIENAVNQLSSQVSSANSELSDLSSKIEALESQAGAGGTSALTYVSLLLALVAIGLAYYLGTRR
jgi:peptide/nickel transport system substrate-binding protein